MSTTATVGGRKGNGGWAGRLAVLLACAGTCVPTWAQDKSDLGRGRATPDPNAPKPIAPGTQPGAVAPPGATTPGQPAARLPPAVHSPAAADEIVLSEFTEPVDLRALVEWVAETLKINIAASDQLSGSVVINAPITVKKDKLLDLLNAMLEQQGYTVYQDTTTGWYRVVASGDVALVLDVTTKIIPTFGIKPSSLAEMVNNQIGQQVNPAGGARALRISYLDDLGVIIFTDTPRRVQMLQDLVSEVLRHSRDQQFIRFELAHVAASVARARVLELLGQATTTGAGITLPNAPGVPAAPVAGPAGAAVVGLADRLNVDAQGNALILRGYPEEADRVARALGVIDRPKVLEYRQYFAGSAAAQIAEMAQRQGLGTVETIDSTPERAPPAQQPGQPGVRGQNPMQFPGLANQQQAGAGGPLMIVDTGRGVIFYYATSSQQQQLASLIKTLDTEREQVVIMAYKLKNVSSDEVSEIISAMIGGANTGGGASSGSSFLPQGGGRSGIRSGTRSGGGRNSMGNSRSGFGQGGGGFNEFQNQFGGGNQRQAGRGTGAGVGAEGESPFGPGTVFVISDRSNNQVLVKAPGKQQEDFAKLIGKLDQRRPQVYIEVQIVAVSANDDFRLAVELQGLNAGGSGGALNTNFGLGSLTSTTGTGDNQTTTGGFTSPKSVVPDLPGLTAAIIRADQVPIVINALKRDTDTRILSSPQILVDDNETAEIVNLEEQPTTSSSQGTSTTETSFAGFEPAGTTLNVTPSISEGGYMRLSYQVELSNFVGTSSAVGIPPVRQTRSVTSDSVTIPGDTTIVVGGIKVDSKTNTIAKVPLLGDIPLLGVLFRDTNRSSSNARLYVFITPRIMRDPNFRDLMLLTRGPQADAGIAPDVPELKPAMIEMVEPAPALPAPAAPTEGNRKANGRT